MPDSFKNLKVGSNKNGSSVNLVRGRYQEELLASVVAVAGGPEVFTGQAEYGGSSCNRHDHWCEVVMPNQTRVIFTSS